MANEIAGESRNNTMRKDESNSSRFSRACTVCCADSPHRRAIFSCGHAVCLACAEQIRMDAVKERRPLLCPFCRKEGAFIKLIEEMVGAQRGHHMIALSICGNDDAATAAAREAVAAANDAFMSAENEHKLAIKAESKAIQAEKNARDALRDAVNAVKKANIASQEAADAHGRTLLDALHSAKESIPEDVYDAIRCVVAAALAEKDVRNFEAAIQDASLNAGRARENITRAFQVEHAAQEAGRAAENALKLEEKRMVFRVMRRENEKSEELGCRYSRRCRACNTDSPGQRAFCAGCGHAVCLKCAEQSAVEEGGEQACFFCGKMGGFVPLYEDRIEADATDEDVPENKEEDQTSAISYHLSEAVYCSNCDESWPTDQTNGLECPTCGDWVTRRIHGDFEGEEEQDGDEEEGSMPRSEVDENEERDDEDIDDNDWDD